MVFQDFLSLLHLLKDNGIITLKFYTLHDSILNLPNKIEDLQLELIQIDLVTCAKYYDHRTPYFYEPIVEDHYFLGYISEKKIH